MRILVLPVTSTRSLIYCQRLSAPSVRARPRIDDRIAAKVGSVWQGFEKSDKPWKQRVVRWTGRLLDTVPFEENGLKTVPPKNTWMRKLRNESRHVPEDTADKENLALEPIPLVYPATSPMTPDAAAAQAVVEKAATEALGRHRKQMLWCVLGMPLTLPFAINPFIPNFPGIYLAYRLWSNWRAYEAAMHLKALAHQHQLVGKTVLALDTAYAQHPKIGPGLVRGVSAVFHDKKLSSELKQALRQVRKQEEKAKKKDGKAKEA